MSRINYIDQPQLPTNQLNKIYIIQPKKQVNEPIYIINTQQRQHLQQQLNDQLTSTQPLPPTQPHSHRLLLPTIQPPQTHPSPRSKSTHLVHSHSNASSDSQARLAKTLPTAHFSYTNIIATVPPRALINAHRFPQGIVVTEPRLPVPIANPTGLPISQHRMPSFTAYHRATSKLALTNERENYNPRLATHPKRRNPQQGKLTYPSTANRDTPYQKAEHVHVTRRAIMRYGITPKEQRALDLLTYSPPSTTSQTRPSPVTELETWLLNERPRSAAKDGRSSSRSLGTAEEKQQQLPSGRRPSESYASRSGTPTLGVDGSIDDTPLGRWRRQQQAQAEAKAAADELHRKEEEARRREAAQQLKARLAREAEEAEAAAAKQRELDRLAAEEQERQRLKEEQEKSLRAAQSAQLAHEHRLKKMEEEAARASEEEREKERQRQLALQVFQNQQAGLTRFDQATKSQKLKTLSTSGDSTASLVPAAQDELEAETRRKEDEIHRRAEEARLKREAEIAERAAEKKRKESEVRQKKIQLEREEEQLRQQQEAAIKRGAPVAGRHSRNASSVSRSNSFSANGAASVGGVGTTATGLSSRSASTKALIGLPPRARSRTQSRSHEADGKVVAAATSASGRITPTLATTHGASQTVLVLEDHGGDDSDSMDEEDTKSIAIENPTKTSIDLTNDTDQDVAMMVALRSSLEPN